MDWAGRSGLVCSTVSWPSSRATSGKGTAAALFATLVDEALSDALRDRGSLADVGDAVNTRLRDSPPEDMFVTMLLAALGEDAVEYIHAGHVRPLLFTSATGEVTELDSGGTTPLGVSGQLDAVADRIAVRPGDALLICSDGKSPSLIDRPELIVSTFENAAAPGAAHGGRTAA